MWGEGEGPAPGWRALEPHLTLSMLQPPSGCKALWVTHSSLCLKLPSKLNLILMSAESSPKPTPRTWLLGRAGKNRGTPIHSGGSCPATAPLRALVSARTRSLCNPGAVNRATALGERPLPAAQLPRSCADPWAGPSHASSHSARHVLL